MVLAALVVPPGNFSHLAAVQSVILHSVKRAVAAPLSAQVVTKTISYWRELAWKAAENRMLTKSAVARRVSVAHLVSRASRSLTHAPTNR